MVELNSIQTEAGAEGKITKVRRSVKVSSEVGEVRGAVEEEGGDEVVSKVTTIIKSRIVLEVMTFRRTSNSQ